MVADGGRVLLDSGSNGHASAWSSGADGVKQEKKVAQAGLLFATSLRHRVINSPSGRQRVTIMVNGKNVSQTPSVTPQTLENAKRGMSAVSRF